MSALRPAWAFERGRLWAMDLTEGEPGPVVVSPRIAAVFSEIRRESAELLAAAMGLLDHEPVRRRLTTGRRCFAAWVADQIAAYGWVSQSAECIGELEREFHLQAGEAYIWNCATLQSYRRKGLYSALLSHIVNQLGGEGLRYAWIGSSLDNRPSIRGFVTAGFHPVITLIYARLINLSCLWITDYPHAPGELVTAARRALAAGHERAWGPLLVGLTGPMKLPACAQIEA